MKDRSVQEGNTAIFFMYSKIQTMSSGRPTEISMFPLNGPNVLVKTLKGEIDQATMTNIITGPGEETVRIQIMPTKEMESQRGKRVISIRRKGIFLRLRGVMEDESLAVRRDRGVATGVGHVVVVEVPLGQGVEAGKGPVAEEEIVELLLNDFSRCFCPINSSAT